MIWALSGFLGTSRDWAPWAPALREVGYFETRATDLFRTAPRGESLVGWACHWADQVPAQDPHPVVMGYSLGARIALHALIARPGIFKRAVIISAGGGIEGEVERRERLARDVTWSEKFRRDPWPKLMNEWNAQPVFGGRRPATERAESDYDRTALAWALREWSPARQDPLWARLHEIRVPLLWVVGAEDAPYVAMAERALAQIPRMELAVIPRAGHRAPWEQPECFARTLQRFLLR